MRKCVFPQWRSPFQTHKKWFQNCFQTHFWIARSVCCFTIQVQVPHFVHEMKWTKIVNCLSTETNLLEKFLFAVAFDTIFKDGLCWPPFHFISFQSFLRNNSCRLGSASMLTPWLPPRPKATLILKIPRYSFNSRYRVQNNLMPQSNEHSLIVIYNLIRNVLCLRCFPFIDRLELITKILSVYKTFLAVIDCGKG